MYTEIFNTEYEIRLGKNQNENDTIIQTSPQNALWFHLKDFPSAHAVITNIINPGTYNKEAIFRAATLVKNASKPGVRNLCKLSVNYVSIQSIKRTNIPGRVILTKSPKCIKV